MILYSWLVYVCGALGSDWRTLLFFAPTVRNVLGLLSVMGFHTRNKHTGSLSTSGRCDDDDHVVPFQAILDHINVAL